MATDRTVTGYSPMQVTLHWMVVVLVAFQFLAHDAIEEAWRSYGRNEPPSGDTTPLVYMHIAAGLLILGMAIARIYLRMTRGAPSPPKDEPRILQLAAEAVHWSIYLFLFLLPASGAIAWFLGIRAAGDAHELLTILLLAAIALHISGALFQHLILRSQVLMRMFRPERR